MKPALNPAPRDAPALMGKRNNIQRSNFGFLWAHDMGADIIATIDDDNIPYDSWGKNIAVGREIEVDYYDCDLLRVRSSRSNKWTAPVVSGISCSALGEKRLF